MMDIRTFVRHLSAYFRSERWVSSNPYFEGGKKRLTVDGRCGTATEAQLFLLHFLSFVTELSKKRGEKKFSKSSSINRLTCPFTHFKSHYDDKGKQIGACKTLD